MYLLGIIGLPPGVGEIGLLIIFIGLWVIAFRQVRRRRGFALQPAPDAVNAAVPDLATLQRLTGSLRRVWLDPEQQVWLAEVAFGRRRFTFCPTDYAQKQAEYQALAVRGANPADVALYALATLVPGGADTMREQIKDADKIEITPDLVRFKPVGDLPGQAANDYLAIGKILSHRDDEAGGVPVTVYRAQVTRTEDFTLTLELAVERTTEPLADGSMAHGSARLYGYLA